MGLNVNKTQFIATCVGGGFSGLAGVYLTLSYVPYWSGNDGWTRLDCLSISYFWRMETIENCWCTVIWIS